MQKENDDIQLAFEVLLDRTNSHYKVTGVPQEIEIARLRNSKEAKILDRITYRGESILVRIGVIDPNLDDSSIPDSVEYIVKEIKPALSKLRIGINTKIKVVPEGK